MESPRTFTKNEALIQSEDSNEKEFIKQCFSRWWNFVNVSLTDKNIINPITQKTFWQKKYIFRYFRKSSE